jgi:hypothetical protein
MHLDELFDHFVDTPEQEIRARAAIDGQATLLSPIARLSSRCRAGCVVRTRQFWGETEHVRNKLVSPNRLGQNKMVLAPLRCSVLEGGCFV